MNEIIIEREKLPRVLTVGKFCVNKAWIHNERHLDIDTLLVVIKGVLYICEEGIDYEVPEGYAFFFKSGCKQYGKRIIPIGTEWYWISFQPTSQLLYNQKLKIPKLIRVHQSDEVCLYVDKMNDLYLNNSMYYEERLNGMLYDLFFRLLVSDKKEKKEPATVSVSDQVIQILNSNIKNKFSSKWIEENLGMSYSYVGRKFKLEMGKTILEFYQELKIRKAITLFLNEEFNITDVSDQLGFPNPYYFSRVFKKVTGLSPRVYLKQRYEPIVNESALKD